MIDTLGSEGNQQQDILQIKLKEWYQNTNEQVNFSKIGTPNSQPSKKKNLAKTFCQKLRTEVGKKNFVQDKYLTFIGDRTSFKRDSLLNIRLMNRNFSLELELRTIERIMKKIGILFQALINVLQKIEVFTPETPIKLIWDSASLISRFYFLFLIPIDIVFSEQSFMFGKYNITSWLFQMILLGDMILGLNTAFYQQGQLVIDRRNIIYHNFKKYYGLEWISTIQLLVYQILTQNDEMTQFIKENKIYLTLVTFAVHYNTIQECVDYYEEGLNLSKKATSILELIKLIAVLFYIIHFFSCFWYWIGDYSFGNFGVSWLDNFSDDSWDQKYLQSIYYSTVTMFTIGYGDILPKSSLEKIICCLFILCASLQLPYSINTVGTIIQSISESGISKKKKLRIINSYMQKKHIPFKLQSEIRQYLNYYWHLNESEDADQAIPLVNQLSENLKDRLIIESNSVILNQCALFRYRFTSAFKKELIKSIKTKIVAPETFVSENNELVFIESGIIDMFGDSQCNLKLTQFEAGQTIGLIPFLTGEKSKETFKSSGFCLILTLSHKKLLQTLKEFPNDYEIFCQINDYLKFNKNDSIIFPKKCYACQSFQHYSDQCPLIHYMADKEKIIKSFTYSAPQIRKSLDRRLRKNRGLFSKTFKQEQLSKSAFIIQQNNPQFIKLYQMDQNDEIDQQAQSLEKYKNIKQSQEKQIDIQRKKELKIKFKKLVKKIQIIDKSYPQFLMVALEKFRINLDYFSKAVQLQQLKKRLEHMKSLQEIDQKLFNEIQTTILKNQDEITINKDFETIRNYVHYNPKFNAENIKIRIDKTRQRISDCYSKYFLYPYEIISQLHSTKTTADLINYKRRKNVFF